MRRKQNGRGLSVFALFYNILIQNIFSAIISTVQEGSEYYLHRMSPAAIEIWCLIVRSSSVLKKLNDGSYTRTATILLICVIVILRNNKTEIMDRNMPKYKHYTANTFLLDKNECLCNIQNRYRYFSVYYV